MFTQDCSEEEDCLERMLVLEPDSPVASADRRHDYKFVSAAQFRDPLTIPEVQHRVSRGLGCHHRTDLCCIQNQFPEPATDGIHSLGVNFRCIWQH